MERGSARVVRIGLGSIRVLPRMRIFPAPGSWRRDGSGNIQMDLLGITSVSWLVSLVAGRSQPWVMGHLWEGWVGTFSQGSGWRKKLGFRICSPSKVAWKVGVREAEIGGTT